MIDFFKNNGRDMKLLLFISLMFVAQIAHAQHSTGGPLFVEPARRYVLTVQYRRGGRLVTETYRFRHPRRANDARIAFKRNRKYLNVQLREVA